MRRLALLASIFLCLALALADGVAPSSVGGEGIIAVTLTSTPTPTPTPTVNPIQYNLTGFENGNNNEAVSTAGTISLVASPVHAGAAALRVNPTGAGTGMVAMGTYSTNGGIANQTATTIYARFFFRAAIIPAAASEEIASWRSTSSLLAALRIYSTGILTVNGANLIFDELNPDDIKASSSTVISANTWYELEVSFSQVGLNPFTFHVRDASSNLLETLSGSPGSGAFGVIAPATFRLGKNVNNNSQSVDFYYDDWTLSTTGWPNPVAIVKRTAPNGVGSYLAWVGGTNASDWQELDEVPSDGDTTYVQGVGNAGERESETLQDSATIGLNTQVIALKSRAICRERDALKVSAVTSGIKSGATISENSVARNVTSNYDVNQEILGVFNLDPATALPWTLSGFDALEVGVANGNTTIVRCTVLDTQVLGVQ